MHNPMINDIFTFYIKKRNASLITFALEKEGASLCSGLHVLKFAKIRSVFFSFTNFGSALVPECYAIFAPYDCG
jgi:hypothetical protein